MQNNNSSNDTIGMATQKDGLNILRKEHPPTQNEVISMLEKKIREL